jgi:pyruvate, water dikinase
VSVVSLIPLKPLIWLDQIQSIDVPWVGESLYTLGQLVRAGQQVLPGFIISAHVLEHFLASNSNLLSLLEDSSLTTLPADGQDHQPLRAIAQQLQNCIQETELAPAWLHDWGEAAQELQAPLLSLQPLWVWADGLSPLMSAQGLVLEQFCSHQPTDIASAVKQLWQTLFQAKSLLFWQRSRIALSQLKLAILVQPAQTPLASGIVYADHDAWHIQATYGLSLAITLGEVTPDNYCIEKATRKILPPRLGQKTHAYRLSAENNTTAPRQSHNLQQPEVQQRGRAERLTSYSPTPPSAEEAVLDDSQLLQLADLLEPLMPLFTAELGLAWSLVETIPGQPKFWIRHLAVVLLEPTQLEAAGSQLSAPVSGDPALTLRVRGLAAAKGQVIAPALVIHDPADYLDHPPQGFILVASAFQPDWLPLLKGAVGIICETGGMTCHGAIMARELGLPAVVGASGATTLIQSQEKILLDGQQGQVFQVMGERQLVWTQNSFSGAAKPHLSKQHLLQTTLTTQLMVNLSQPASLPLAQSLPVDGVGLLRSELMLLEILEQQHPYLWLQQGRQSELLELWAALIQRFMSAFSPRPIFYRSLDLRSHEYRLLKGGADFEPLETNPMLGQRGTARYLASPALFDLELKALARVYQQGNANLHLILPFVRSVAEFEFCRQRVARAGLLDYPQFQLWLMAEVPSILFLLPDYVRAGAQGISIGSNDLTQLLLGIDRHQTVQRRSLSLGHSSPAQPLDESHPAVMAAIAQIIQAAQSLGIPCSICGEAPVQYPELVGWLVNLGINSISVPAESVLDTRWAIARAEQHLQMTGRRPK